MRRPLAAVSLALLATTAAADEMSDRLCPILAAVAADASGAIPEAVQAQLVMRVAGAWDYDPDALQAVLDGADAATGAACPADRAAIVQATGKESLAEAMR
jgi:hypothetical protein